MFEIKPKGWCGSMNKVYGLIAVLTCSALLIVGCSSSETASSSDSKPAMMDTDTTAQAEHTDSQESGSEPSSDHTANEDGSQIPGEQPSTYSLTGSIAGKYPIEMKLTLDGSNVGGTYMYTKYKQDLKLQGTVDQAASTRDKISVSMDEFDQNGELTGHFVGALIYNTASHSPALLSFSGDWSNADGTNTIPFEVTPVGSSTSSATNTVVSDADWLGEWELKDSTQFVNQGLEIQEVTPQSISFNLDSFDGGHTGGIMDKAVRSKDGKSAVFTGDGLSLTFTLQGDRLVINSEGDPTNYAGAGVSFGGEFVRHSETQELDLQQLGVLPSKEVDDQFRAVVGDDYDLFTQSFQLFDSQSDKLTDTTVVTGGVRGLFTIMEAVIMYDQNGRFYAAVIDGDKVNYYTTERSSYNKLPDAIEQWRSRFKDKDVVYLSFA
ncbi:hypothetical protein H8B09_23890 [Paenibacillus sp. PR3]|uniref:Uncharacterized protein n=1 Tax=Paenibacillus terricola TaxID=2763503 RepID=A0ABR8N0U8_9BACL|nr:hypothetical protein [Paenibacillus terricola]MBD3921823.1 hypothetical protein [Paenibacillus terricola]